MHELASPFHLERVSTTCKDACSSVFQTAQSNQHTFSRSEGETLHCFPGSEDRGPTSHFRDVDQDISLLPACLTGFEAERVPATHETRIPTAAGHRERPCMSELREMSPHDLLHPLVPQPVHPPTLHVSLPQRPHHTERLTNPLADRRNLPTPYVPSFLGSNAVLPPVSIG